MNFREICRRPLHKRKMGMRLKYTEKHLVLPNLMLIFASNFRICV